MADLNSNPSNKIITPEDEKALKKALEEVNRILKPYLKTPKKKEPKSPVKTVLTNTEFCNDALLQFQKLDGIGTPLTENMISNINTDLKLNKQMKDYKTKFIDPLNEKVSETERLTNQNSYSSSISLYNLIKLYAEAKVPGALEAYEFLKKKYFNRSGNISLKATTPNG